MCSSAGARTTSASFGPRLGVAGPERRREARRGAHPAPRQTLPWRTVRFPSCQGRRCNGPNNPDKSHRRESAPGQPEDQPDRPGLTVPRPRKRPAPASARTAASRPVATAAGQRSRPLSSRSRNRQNGCRQGLAIFRCTPPAGSQSSAQCGNSKSPLSILTSFEVELDGGQTPLAQMETLSEPLNLSGAGPPAA